MELFGGFGAVPILECDDDVLWCAFVERERCYSLVWVAARGNAEFWVCAVKPQANEFSGKERKEPVSVV